MPAGEAPLLSSNAEVPQRIAGTGASAMARRRWQKRGKCEKKVEEA